jgi:hypothetical protein
MITYEKLSKKPQVAQRLIGMTLTEFDSFYAEFETAHEARLQTSQLNPAWSETPTLCWCKAETQVRFAKSFADDLVLVEDLHHL